ncbi:LysR family transcriptional regulator [Shewanella abyssi]|uniref:LysR family transcriptional regulator n=1 Tax=Shewanella abyssi TaxID=311789 RepID=UPI0020100036|nr:LysR family transcriptional regulator [Shewanella abyssi]MCL1049371.1 LysR family transcriptional regulator [Shewanella abyssi]
MELRHLKHFVTLAEYKNYSLAAGQLNISQPSLSRSIQRLEKILDVKLMERNSRYVKLTYFGSVVLEHSQKILGNVSSLESDISLNVSQVASNLVLGGGVLAGPHILNELLSEFTKDNPNYNMELCFRYVSELYDLLVKGEIDLFLGETKITRLDQKSDLNIIPFCQSKGIFCCRSGHPLLSEEYLYTPRLKDYQVALPRGTPHEIESLFDDLFDIERKGFSGLVKFEEIHSILHSLHESDIICLLPDLVIQKELDAGRVATLNVLNMPEIEVEYGMVTLKDKVLSQATKEFIEFINNR